MNLDAFQRKRLDAYFSKHATPELKARREERKMTIKGAYEWIKTKLQKTVEVGGTQTSNGVCIVGDDQWCYDEMMHYFLVCSEGDTYKTDEEIKAEEERLKSEADKRKEKAEKKRKQHAERVAKWQTLTAEQIAADVKRTRWLKKHSWLSGKSAEEIDRQIAEEEAQEKERKAKEEEKAKEKAEREAEKKRKAEERAKKEAEKKAAKDRKAKFKAEQLSLF